MGGQPLDVKDTEFKPMIAALAIHEVEVLQQKLAIRVASRMDADSQLNALAASDRPNDVKRLRRQLQSATAVIQKLMDRLAGWLQHPDLQRTMLPEPLQIARDTVSAWDVAAFQQGRFPWEADQHLSQSLSQDQLISRLRLYLNQQRRAREELTMLKAERETSLKNYQQQLSALQAAMELHERLQSADASCPPAASTATQSKDWHAGVCLLLRKKQSFVSKIYATAQQAFGTTAAGSGDATACLESYETVMPNDIVSDDESLAGDD